MAGEHWGVLDSIEGVACPRCQGALFPIFTREKPEGFAFGCSDAHIVGLRELFTVQSTLLRKSLEDMINSWEQAVRQMADGADLARQRGFHEVADRFERRIGDLRTRIRILRELFLTPEGGRTPPVTLE